MTIIPLLQPPTATIDAPGKHDDPVGIALCDCRGSTELRLGRRELIQQLTISDSGQIGAKGYRHGLDLLCG